MSAQDRPWHRCPVEGCRQMVADGYIACGPHYKTIPEEWREVLARAFRAREQDPELYALAVFKARRLLGAS